MRIRLRISKQKTKYPIFRKTEIPRQGRLSMSNIQQNSNVKNQNLEIGNWKFVINKEVSCLGKLIQF